jgi:hypothetical protein
MGVGSVSPFQFKSMCAVMCIVYTITCVVSWFLCSSCVYRIVSPHLHGAPGPGVRLWRHGVLGVGAGGLVQVRAWGHTTHTKRRSARDTSTVSTWRWPVSSTSWTLL